MRHCHLSLHYVEPNTMLYDLPICLPVCFRSTVGKPSRWYCVASAHVFSLPSTFQNWPRRAWQTCTTAVLSAGLCAASCNTSSTFSAEVCGQLRARGPQRICNRLPVTSQLWLVRRSVMYRVSSRNFIAISNFFERVKFQKLGRRCTHTRLMASLSLQ